MPIRLTQTVKAILIVCFISFLIQQTGDQFFGTHILESFGLVPYGFWFKHQYWQLFTYAFLHADVMHLFFNLLMLAFIGGELEMIWGRNQFLKYYFFCSICAGLAYLALQFTLMKGVGLYSPMVGASGGIYGLLTAYGLLFGERVFLFMLVIPMKAKHFVLVLGLIELLTTVYSSGKGLAGVAHLGGMVAGFFYLWARARYILMKKRKQGLLGQFSRPKRKRSRHLKLIVDNDQDSDPDDQTDKNDPTIWH